MVTGQQTSIPNAETEHSLDLTRKQRLTLMIGGLVLGDILAIGAAFLIAYLIRFETLVYYSEYSYERYNRLSLMMIPVWLFLFAAFQLYNHNLLWGGLQEYSRAFNAISLGTLLLMTADFFIRSELPISRGWLILTWLMALILVVGMRFTIRQIIYALRKSGRLLSPTLVVGANAEGRALVEQLRDWKTSGLYINGFIDDSLPSGTSIEDGYAVLGGLKDLNQIVSQQRIEEIVVAPTALNRDQLLEIFQKYTTNTDVTIRLSSGMFEILSTGVRVKEFAYVPLMELNDTRISGMDGFMKLVIDYALTIPGIILISPLLVVIAIAVKRDSPGPVFHRRRVMGLNGTQFNALKFRTMYTNGDEILDDHPHLKQELDETFKLKDDPRITRIGNLLRKYSLDELPQCFNVLAGQMSLVGPRMISPPEMEKYGKWGMNLLTVKPGITGMWQVSGRSDIAYEERVRIDMNYIRNWNVWLDLYLLLRTPRAVIRKKGAY